MDTSVIRPLKAKSGTDWIANLVFLNPLGGYGQAMVTMVTMVSLRHDKNSINAEYSSESPDLRIVEIWFTVG